MTWLRSGDAVIEQAVVEPSLEASSTALTGSNENALWIGAIGFLVTAVTFAHVRNPQVGFDKFSLPKELSFQVLTLMICAKHLADRNNHYAISLSWRRSSSLCLTAFVVCSVVGWLAIATNSWEASRAVGISASMLVLWVLIGASTDRDLVKIVAITVGVVGAAGLASILDALGTLPGLSMPHRGPGGVLGNRNYASHLFVLTLPACWYLFRRARRTSSLVLISLGTSLMIAPIVFGRSRGAWLGAGAALAGGLAAGFASGLRLPSLSIYKLKSRAIRPAVFMGAILVGAITGVLVARSLWVRTSHPLAETVRHITDASSGSGHDRLVQYSTSLRIIRDHPILGVGPGNWSVAYAYYATEGDRSFDRTAVEPVNRFASSDFVDLAAERGVLSLGLLLVTIAFSWLDSARASRRTLAARRDESATPTEDFRAKTDQFLALTALFCAYLTMAMVDSLIVQAPVAVVLAIFASAWSRGDRPHCRRKPRVPVRMFSPRILFGLTSVLLLVSVNRVARSLFVVAVYSSHASVADLNTLTAISPGDYGLHVLLAKRAAKMGDCRLLRDQAEKADALYPFRPLLPLFRGGCLTDVRSGVPLPPPRRGPNLPD